MSEQLTNQEGAATQETPKSYRKIQAGETGWTEPLDENFQVILEQLGQGSILQNLLEGVKEEAAGNMAELEAKLTQQMDDRVAREEFNQSQQRQDNAIDALQRSLDSGFTGASVTHSFAAGELPHWQGWDGPLAMGAVNESGQLTN